MPASYPSTAPERDRWILSRRGPRNSVKAEEPYAFFIEPECSESGIVEPVTTVLLTNRECPWRCLMCDLWRNTLPETVPLGTIPAQLDFALTRLSPANQIKLYNSGSFFDPRAIPPADLPLIAEKIAHFKRVIVECHPSLVREECLRFRDQLKGQLEIAMGLETAHPEVLERLNKRMSLDLFAKAADFLKQHEIALRVFIMVKPPFITDEAEALFWAKKSIDFAFECGATAVSLIPTRAGNGALETLATQGLFAPPQLATLESALDYGIALGEGRVFADLWDLERLANCHQCFSIRADRLREMNLCQKTLPRISCEICY